MASWDSFFVAAAAASGALAGLVFVALSINLARILELPDASGRAADTVLLLAAALFGALLALAPHDSSFWVGVVALGVWLPSWGLPTWSQLRMFWRRTYYRLSFAWLRLFLHQLATVPYIVAAMLLWGGHSEAGLRWFAAGIVLSMAVALMSAWVLLVEILR